MPEPVVAALDGAWNDTTGASNVNIASVVDCTAESVNWIVLSEPEPCADTHESCEYVFQETVSHTDEPILIVGVVSADMKFIPLIVIVADPETGELPALCSPPLDCDTTGESYVNMLRTVPTTEETVKTALTLVPWPLSVERHKTCVIVVHDVVPHIESPIEAV
jgi:hypothetical protein